MSETKLTAAEEFAHLQNLVSEYGAPAEDAGLLTVLSGTSFTALLMVVKGLLVQRQSYRRRTEVLEQRIAAQQPDPKADEREGSMLPQSVFSDDVLEEAKQLIHDGLQVHTCSVAEALLYITGADTNNGSVVVALSGLIAQKEHFRVQLSEALQKVKRLEFDNRQLTRQTEMLQAEHAAGSTKPLMTDFVRFVAARGGVTAEFTIDVARLVGRFEESIKERTSDDDTNG